MAASAGADSAEWAIVTTTGRGVLPSPRCAHTLSLTGAGDSASRHLIVAFGETTKTKERKFFNDVYALSNGMHARVKPTRGPR